MTLDEKLLGGRGGVMTYHTIYYTIFASNKYGSWHIKYKDDVSDEIKKEATIKAREMIGITKYFN